MPCNLSPALIALRDRIAPEDISAPSWRIRTKGKSDDPATLVLSFGQQGIGSIRLDDKPPLSKAERTYLCAAADLTALSAARADLLKLFAEMEAPGSVASENAELRAELGEAKREIEKTDAHYAEVLEERHREIESLREGVRQLVKERDTAKYNAGQWEKAAGKNLTDLNDAKRDLAGLRGINESIGELATAHQDQIERLTTAPGLAGRLGRWLWRKAGEGMTPSLAAEEEAAN